MLLQRNRGLAGRVIVESPIRLGLASDEHGVLGVEGLRLAIVVVVEDHRIAADLLDPHDPAPHRVGTTRG